MTIEGRDDVGYIEYVWWDLLAVDEHRVRAEGWFVKMEHTGEWWLFSTEHLYDRAELGLE